MGRRRASSSTATQVLPAKRICHQLLFANERWHNITRATEEICYRCTLLPKHCTQQPGRERPKGSHWNLNSTRHARMHIPSLVSRETTPRISTSKACQTIRRLHRQQARKAIRSMKFHVYIFLQNALDDEVDMTAAFHRSYFATIHCSQKVTRDVIVLSRIHGYLYTLSFPVSSVNSSFCSIDSVLSDYKRHVWSLETRVISSFRLRTSTSNYSEPATLFCHISKCITQSSLPASLLSLLLYLWICTT